MRRNLERAARHDIMTDAVAGFLAAFLAGAARVQTDRFHPLRPFAIVIAAAAGLAAMVLPQMHHFMDEGGQHFGDRTHMEIARIERDLVGDQPVSAAEPVAAEIPVAALAALQGDEAIGQFAFEQGPVEIRIGFLKLVVGLLCGFY